MFKIPLFDLNMDDAEGQAVVETIRSNWISSGPRTIALEEKFASMWEVKHALAITNCTAALHLAMEIAGIGDGDEVICPSLTFVATVNAIRYVRATPVFADVESLERPVIDPRDIEAHITPRTKAIVVMHFGGFACDMDQIIDIAQRHRLKVIEDACHGPLSRYKGRVLGTLGDVGCFSFFSNKNISTGEGGMLVTNDEAMFHRAKLLRSHGMTTMSFERAGGHATSYDVVEVGYNYRMDDMRSAIALVQLDKLMPDLEKRAIVRQNYLKYLNGITEIVIPFRDEQEFTSNYIFTVILEASNSEKRDAIRDFMADQGVQTSVHYPAAHLFSFYKGYSRVLPQTEYITDCLLTLPMYGNLTEENVKYIADTLKAAIHATSR